LADQLLSDGGKSILEEVYQREIGETKPHSGDV